MTRQQAAAGPGRRRRRAPAVPPDDEVLARVIGWLGHQRWFAGGDAEAAQVTLLRRAPLLAEGDVTAEFLLLGQGPSGEDAEQAAYVVILGWRSTLPERLDHAAIGPVGGLICYDALHDDDVTARLLDAVFDGVAIGPLTPTGVGPDERAEEDRHGLVMSVEQSNTSVVFGHTLIMKFFRRLEPGINPDAELSAALAGRPYTAGYRGELRTDLAGEPTTVALVSDFIPNSADAWSLATTSVRDLLAEGDLHPDEVGGDFATEAFRMGGVIAHLHRDLADAFGERPLGDGAMERLLAGVVRDATAVAERVPELAELLTEIRRTCDELAGEMDAADLVAQRIHGDLHLGQVLRTVGGWVVIDFEGEPSVPLSERRGRGSRLRDVAGLIRSFDYAARQPLYTSSTNPQRAYRSDEWLTHNRAAFLDGYAQAYGRDPRDRPAVLTAFELAKAVYEVDYEQRHRPPWVRIPLDAVRALTAPS